MSVLTAVRDTLTGFKSLLVGMRITAREAAKPVITVQYPHETLKMPDRFRGHVKLVLDPETGKARCTACGLCARACPSGCIVLEGVKREGEKRKSVSRYELDFTKCSLCGSCVEICASDALDFSKDYNVVSLDRGSFSHMDLYQKIEAEAKAWASAHPQPAAAVASAPAVPAAPATPVIAAATPPAAAPGPTAVKAQSPSLQTPTTPQ
jgi:NADH-quinone oxidoreductase subunit I